MPDLPFWVVTDDAELGALGRKAAERAYDPARVRVIGCGDAETQAAWGAPPAGALVVGPAAGSAAALRALAASLEERAPLVAVLDEGRAGLPDDLAQVADVGRLVRQGVRGGGRLVDHHQRACRRGLRRLDRW